MADINRQLRILSSRLTLYVQSLALVVLLVCSAVIISKTYNYEKERAISKAASDFRLSGLLLSETLQKVEKCTWDSMEYIDLITSDTSSCYKFLDVFLSPENGIYSASLMFREGYYPGRKEDFIPCSYILSSESGIQHLNAKFPGYTYDDDSAWIAGLKGKSSWCDPFGIELFSKRNAVSFSIPLRDSDNEVFAVLNAFLDVRQIETMLEDCINDDLTAILVLNSGGKIVCCKDMNYVTHSFIDIIKEDPGKNTLGELYKRMIGQENGMMDIRVEGCDYIVFYSPLGSADWYTAAAYPLSHIASRAKRMSAFILLIGLTILILLFFIIKKGMLHLIRPFSNRLEKVTRESASLEKDLEIAAGVQLGMLPDPLPTGALEDNVELAAVLKPAKLVGGDLYDYFVSDGCLYFCIGDISGKGAPASLLMAMIITVFRDIAPYEKDPAAIASGMNRRLSGNDNMFCTAFIGKLDIGSGKLEFCNAGHNPPMLSRKDNGPEYMKPLTNVCLGAFENTVYESESLELHCGDAILLYTDGVTEAENISKRRLGDARAIGEFGKFRNLDAETVVNNMLKSVTDYAGQADQSDDITMLFIRLIRKN